MVSEVIFRKRKPAYSQAEIHQVMADIKDLREMRLEASSMRDYEEAARITTTIELAERVLQRMLEKVSEQ